MATKKKPPTKAKPSDETWDTQRFKEQCFLASFWRPIVNFYRQQTFASCLEHEGSPIYDSKHALNETKGFASPEFLTMLDCKVPQVTGNLLTSVKDVGKIVNIKNNLKALLVPRLQIYKLLPVDDNAKGITADNFYADKFKKYEYPFPAHVEMQDGDSLGTPNSSRWKNKEKNSFGIESFTVKTTATDQSQVDAALVTCNLNLYFSSIHDLFEKRDFFPTDPSYSVKSDTIASLITNTDKVEDVKKNSADKDAKVTKQDSNARIETDFARSFIIMASIGWQSVTEQEIQRADPLLSEEERQAFYEAIDKCKQNIILYLVQYNFDIKEDGTVKLSIEYAGNIDTAYGSNKFDILGGEISEDKIQELINKEAKTEKSNRALMLQVRRAGASAIRLSRNSDKCTADIKDWASGAIPRDIGANCSFVFQMSENLRRYYSKNHSNILTLYDKLYTANKPTETFNLNRFINEADKSSEGLGTFSSMFDLGFLESIMSPEQEKKFSEGFGAKFKAFVTAVRNELGNLAAKESISDEETIRRIKAKYKISQYRNVMENLYQEGKIHFIEMDIDLYESWKVWLRREQIGGEFKEKKESEEEPSKWKFVSYKEYDSYKAAAKKCKPGNKNGCYLDEDTGIMIYNIKKALEANNDIVTKPSSLNKRRINFVYFADILDAAIKTIRGHVSDEDDEAQLNDFVDQFKRKRIILGNVILQDKILPDKELDLDNSSYKKYSINVGDLPISLHSYVNWFQKRASNLKLEEWSLKRFIMDCARVLLSDAFGYGCDSKINQRTNIRSVVIESYLEKDRDTPGEFINKIPLKPRVVLTDDALSKFKLPDTDAELRKLNESNNGVIGFLGDPGKSKPRSDVESDEICTMLYIFGESFERNNLKAKKSEDEKMGIYHFNLGQDKGLVKSIKFEVDKDSILRTVRIVDSQDNDNNLSQIRDIYNANISMIGNPLFRPGMLVYIDPTLPGYSPVDPNSKALIRNIGMGGYYMILNVDSSISNSDYKTDLTTVAVVTAADIRNDVSEIHSENTKILFPDTIGDINKKNKKGKYVNIPLYMYKDRLEGA